MDEQLIEHGRAKFPRAGLIATSAGRNWAGVHAERRQHPAGELPPHIGAVTEITYALRGNPLSVVHRRGSGTLQKTPVLQGTIWICPEGILESETRITQDLPDILHVCLPDGLFAQLSEEIFPRLSPKSLRYEAGVEDPLIAHMISAVSGELLNETSSGNLLVEATSLALGARLALHYAEDVTCRRRLLDESHALDQKRLRRVLDYINANLENHISVEDLARAACLSQFHFSRAFKRSTGKSPHSFLSERRLERAKTLLKHGDLPITEIAFACNFSSQASFTKAFTRTVGSSPGRYRTSAT